VHQRDERPVDDRREQRRAQPLDAALAPGRDDLGVDRGHDLAPAVSGRDDRLGARQKAVDRSTGGQRPAAAPAHAVGDHEVGMAVTPGVLVDPAARAR
jgi:hypothetical protein